MSLLDKHQSQRNEPIINGYSLTYNGSRWVNATCYDQAKSNERKLLAGNKKLTSLVRELQSQLDEWNDPSSAGKAQKELAKKDQEIRKLQSINESKTKSYNKEKNLKIKYKQKCDELSGKYLQAVKDMLKVKDALNDKTRECKHSLAREKNYKNDCEKYKHEIQKVKECNQQLREQIKVLTAENNQLKLDKDQLTNQQIDQKAQLNQNSNNSGIPTSKTPIGEQKRNPKKVNCNTGTPTSGKNKGGQKGHKKNCLELDDQIPVDEKVVHIPDALKNIFSPIGKIINSLICPQCGENLSESDIEIKIKDEYDIQISKIRRRHYFISVICPKCKTQFKVKIPKNLKMSVQYGEQLKTFIVLLLRQGFVSINRLKKIISGMFKIDVSEGFISNVNQAFNERCHDFAEKLSIFFQMADVLCWDDTVVFSKGKQICFRSYITDWFVKFTAHKAKDKQSLIDDGILTLLTADTYVMHDHNTVNYNDLFKFINVECNVHLLRDLINLNENYHLEWPQTLRNRIVALINNRNELVETGATSLPQDTIDDFTMQTKKELLEQKEIAERNIENHINEQLAMGNHSPKIEPPPHDRELLCITKRLLNEKYFEAYFRWMKDFSIPVTNNVTERSFRDEKTHMKISAGFDSIKTAKAHADGQTYLKTCGMNGISFHEAIRRMLSDDPITIEELGFADKLKQKTVVRESKIELKEAEIPPPS